MDWFKIGVGIVVVIIPLIAALWGGWKLWKHIPREVGEALIVIADALEDDRLTIDEVRAIVARYHRIINAITKALGRDITPDHRYRLRTKHSGLKTKHKFSPQPHHPLG